MQINELPDGSYEVEFRTQHGTIGRVPLGTTDREEARSRVASMHVEELEKVSGIVGLTHQVVGQIIAGKDITLSAAISLWRAHVSNRRILAPNTVAVNEILLRQWAKTQGLNETPLCAVGPDAVSAFVNTGREKRSSALRKLGAIRGFFNYLFNEGLVLRNPAAKGMVRISYDPFTHAEKETRVKDTFSDEEIGRLLVVASPFWRAAIVISRDTGLRLSDVCQLEWASVQRPECGATDSRNESIRSLRADLPIVVWTDKTNTRVNLDTTADISRVLGDLPNTGITHVFPDRCATIRDPKRRANLSTEFRRLCIRAGLDGKKTFHCLRHTYASRMVREGLTVEQTAANLGHRDAATTRIYIHPDRATS